MPDAHIYCEQLLREGDKDRFLATLFAPAAYRPALFALYAFDLEITRVVERVNEPLAGEIRLQWWLDAISGAIPEQVAGNPVAAAFLETLKTFRLPLETVLDMIEAQRLDLYPPDDQSENHAERKAAGLLSLAARILSDGADPGIDDLIRNAAAATAATAHVDPSHVQRRLDASGALLAAAPRAVLPAFLPLALIRARLDLIERTNNPSAEMSQWRKQWILWRASKKLSAWL